ncbi:hypothetical protein DEO72_LG1g2138 [Vigna unguiculata]|uniref:Uncharacterized protein n=1 Tax=Vigna unguiculata TaxID=3917 RepID=A0A4D6KXM8_VIGUN|nr:hypothetical protein DEO72_LG1g2138 [Vigna unguiculata]
MAAAAATTRWRESYSARASSGGNGCGRAAARGPREVTNGGRSSSGVERVAATSGSRGSGVFHE